MPHELPRILLNALKALHAVRYSGDEDLEKNEEEE